MLHFSRFSRNGARLLPGAGLCAVSLLPFLTSPGAASAWQDIERVIGQVAGRAMNQDEILQQLSELGITREQAKERLRGFGYDPALVDPYFDRLEGLTTDSIPLPGSDFVGALQRIGLVRLTGGSVPGLLPLESVDTLGYARREPPPEALTVFGLDIFARPLSFEVVSGPADPDYRVAPGDALGLFLTGDVQIVYSLVIDREGYLTIPDVGRILVNGLTMAELKERMTGVVGRSYSGLESGTTALGVTLEEARTNQVFVTGEVYFPNAYQVSGLATVFHVLHMAGGPTPRGSFRNVRVLRSGEVVREVDLYAYLLEGDASNDIRLLQGDIVFVPLSRPRVAMTGGVRRPAIYELGEYEGLGDALRFSGGFSPSARGGQIHVYRILPLAERTGVRDRVLVDVGLEDLLSGETIPMADADSVVVREIRDERANVVVVDGQVERPGDYEYRTNMSMWELVERAGGLLPDAFRPVAHVFRLNEADSTFQQLRASLETGPTGPVDDLLLQDQDRVVVYSGPRLAVPQTVSIEGFVKDPGQYDLAEGMTVELMAGGFIEGAHGVEAEVSRLRTGLTRSDTISRSTTVQLTATVPWPYEEVIDRFGDNGNNGDGVGRGGLLRADEYPLEAGDRIFVRRLPGFVEPASVDVVGEVANPGPYPIRFREERVSSVLRRAGGLTDEAFIEGGRLVRDSTLVGISLTDVLREPGGPADLLLEAGDRPEFPRYTPTVTVMGAVAFTTKVPCRDGMNLGDYLADAGGTLDDGNRDRVIVEYANGSRAISSKFFWVRRDPEVRPGATLRVPFKGADGTDWDQILTRTLSITTTLATLLLAVSRL